MKVKDDWWPDRDKVCWKVCYALDGADLAIKRCKKTELVIQAGGCVGVWPRHLKQAFTRVVTFEPSLENFNLLLKNLEGVEGIEKHWAALGTKSGRCGVKEDPANCGNDQTVPEGEVPVVAIDDLWLEPDLIYLDIQGDELAALKGAEQTIERCSPVIAIEVDNKLSRKGDAVGYLGSVGYKHVDTWGQDYIFVR